MGNLWFSTVLSTLRIFDSWKTRAPMQKPELGVRMSSATRMHSLSVTSGPRRGDLFLDWRGCCMHWPDTTVGCRSTTADVCDCISRMSGCNQSACFFFWLFFLVVFFWDWNPIIVKNSSLSASSFADIETLASVTFRSAEININRSICFGVLWWRY